MPNPVIIEVRANTSQAKGQLDGLSKSFKNFGSSIRSVVAMSSQTVTGLRQMAQGVQNLGFTMSAMIGLPLAAAMRGMSDEALKFERQMVEVQKTTGLATKDIQALSEQIRELAKATPTSATELATLAAEAGRAGVGLQRMLEGDTAGAQAEILEFVRVLDMMQVSTTLTAEEGAQAFGRFMTIFDEIDTTNIENLGSAINELGQSSSVSEDEIVGAMMRIAPAAATLGLAAPDVAGLATAITQMSESMSRGGTRVRTALEGMGLQWEKVAKLIGESSASIKQRLQDDALGVFMEIIEALGQVESNTDRLAIATEIFGRTGANAMQRFVGSFDELQQLMAISNQAFDEGTSLQIEFNRALGATTEQLKVLKNNIIDVGMQFMNDLLPIAKEIIGALIPAVQDLGQWVAQLSIKQKMLIAGIAALVVAGLPLLALLGSLGFGFAMIINGLVNVVGGLVGLIATIMTFGSGISFVSIALGGLAALLGGTLVVYILKATKTFDIIVDKLEEIAEGAIDWGEGLIANIAEGIISGAASILVSALNFVGNLISDYLMPGSPPKTGPLSTINQWGKRLIDVFLQGFRNADFDILKDVTGIIKHVLESLVDLGKIKGADVGPMLDLARTKVAKLIDIFNKTGEISQSILQEISKMLGEAGDETVKLLSLQLRYNQALKDLERIRQKKSDIDEAYKAEVRSIMKRTDLTEAEKMNLIRQAKERRNLAQENADTEEKAAQKNADALKDQVDWQKKYIQSQMDTDDIWKQHLATLKKVGKAASKAAKGIKSLAQKLAEALEKLLKQLEANLKLQEEYKKKGMDITPLLREELSIRKRIVKNLMERGDLTADERAMLDANLDRIKELESILDTASKKTVIPTMDVSGADAAATTFKKSMQQMGDATKGFTDILAKGRESWEAFKAGILGKDIAPTIDAPEGLLAMLPEEDIAVITGGLTETQNRFYEWGQKLYEVKERVVGTINDLKRKFADFKESIATSVSEIANSVQSFGIADKFKKSQSIIVPALLAIGGAILFLKGPLRFLMDWGGFNAAIGPVVGALGTVKNSIMGLGKTAAGAGGSIFGFFNGLPKIIFGALGGAGGAIGGFGKTILGLARNFGSLGKNLGVGIIQSIIGFGKALSLNIGFLRGFLPLAKQAPGVFAKFVAGGIWRKIAGLPGLIMKIGPAFKMIFGLIITILSNAGGAIIGFITSITTFIAPIVAVGGAIIAAIAAIAAAVYYIIDNWEKFKDTFLSMWDNIKAGVEGFVESFKKALGVGSMDGLNFAKVLGFIYEKAEPLAKFLAGTFVKALHMISGIIKIILPALGKALGGILKGIGAFAVGVLDAFGGLFKVFEALWKVITGEGDWTAVGDALKSLGQGILEMFGGIVIAVGNVFSGLIDVVLGIFSSIIDGIVNVFGETKFLKGVRDFINGVIEWFQKLYDQLLGHSIIPDIVNGIKEWFAKIAKPFMPLIKAIKGFLKYIKVAAKFVKTAFKAKGMAGGLGAILKVFGPLQKVIKPVIEVVWSFYKVITPLIDAFKEGFAEGGLTGAFERIKQVLPSVLSALGGLLGNLMTMIPKMLVAMGELFIQKGLPAIMGFVTAVYNYLAANLPSWLTALVSTLAKIGSALWGWITSTGLPWVIDVVKKIGAYLIQNVPGWVTSFLGALATVAGALWNWIKTDAIPWIVEVVKAIAGYIIENAPGWVESFIAALLLVTAALAEWIINDFIPWAADMMRSFIDTVQEKGPEWVSTVAATLANIAKEIGNWIRTEGIPLLEGFIKDGVEIFAKIGSDWLEKIKEGLEEIKKSFSEIFEDVKDIISTTIKSGINKMLSSLEKGINRVVDGINDFIKTINDIAGALGLGSLPTLKRVRIKRLAQGGIVTSPLLAMIGEGGQDEAVLPLDRLENMFNNGGKQVPQTVNITIENPTVRSEDDMQRMIDAIQYELGIRLGTKATLLGRGMSY